MFELSITRGLQYHYCNKFHGSKNAHITYLSDEQANTVVAVEKNQGLQMFTASECLQKYFCFTFFVTYSVRDPDSPIPLALEAFATIP